jgi:hypothetical protein
MVCSFYFNIISLHWRKKSKSRTSSNPINVARLECLDNYIRACLITRDGAMLIVGEEAGHIFVADIAGRTLKILSSLVD